MPSDMPRLDLTSTRMSHGRMRRGRPTWWLVSGALLAVTLVAACGADDREMRPPSASQTTTTTAAQAGAGTGGGVGTATELLLQLVSTAFGAEEAIPDQYTCRGRNVSPPLEWANLPAGTTELALAMIDLDANNFVHWLVTGIPPTVGGLAEGQLPDGAVAWPNSFGDVGWGGPCPPSGTHRYEFRLLALSEAPGLSGAADAAAAFDQLARLPAVATATLTGTVTG